MARKPASLALHLTVTIGAVITCVLFAFGWVVERSINSHFIQQDVDELNAVIQAVAEVLRKAPPNEFDDELSQRLAGAVSGHHNAQFRLLDANYKEIYTSSNLKLEDFQPAVLFSSRITAETVEVWQNAGKTYRGAAVQLLSPTLLIRQPLILTVVTDIDFHLHYLEGFRTYLKLITLIASLIAIFATWLAVYLGHAPLRRISQEIQQIKSDHLFIRLDPDLVPIELTELAISFNAMLSRIEEGFQRLSNFSADIAHELRTPITNLKTQTEVVLSKPRTNEEYQEVLYSCLEEYERMAKMVGDMLFLAQADNNKLKKDLDKVSLNDEVKALFDYFEALAEEQQITLTCEGVVPLIVGDRLMLRRALSNILSNAIRYTTQGEEIKVHLEQKKTKVIICISNQGVPVSSEHLPKLFDRFYRVDPSRQRKNEGTGLGLAITQSIIASHGGTITAKNSKGRMTFELVLPIN